MSENRVLAVSAYLQLKPTWSQYSPTRVVAVSVARVTALRPNKPLPGTVLVKIDLSVPSAVFDPLSTGTIEVGMSDAVVTAHAEDAAS